MHELGRDHVLQDGAIHRRRLLALGAGFSAAGFAGCRTGGPSRSAAADPQTGELFAALTDQRSSVRPIQPAERAARRRRLGSILGQAGLDAFLCEGGATMSYLAGVSWGHSERLFGLIVLADGSHFWICPAFERQKASLRIGGDDGPGGTIVEWDEHEYAWAPLAAALRERSVSRIGIDPEARYFIADRLAERLGAERVRSGAAAVHDLRTVKDARELELLRKASELTQSALVAVAPHVRPGMRASELSRLVHASQRKLGLQNTWALCLVGPAAAYPHGNADDPEIRAGEFVLIDTGGAFHEYQSDTTRTWSIGGPPSARAERAWYAVRDAQLRAFEALKPGVPCSAIDRAARQSLEAAGFGSGYRYFTHRLGHGIGMRGHEDPYFDGRQRRGAPGGHDPEQRAGAVLLRRVRCATRGHRGRPQRRSGALRPVAGRTAFAGRRAGLIRPGWSVRAGPDRAQRGDRLALALAAAGLLVAPLGQHLARAHAHALLAHASTGRSAGLDA